MGLHGELLRVCKVLHLKTKWTSGLPVGIDATQSGIQHLSAMTLDGNGVKPVNLTPGEKPMDGYKTVAEYAAKLLDKPQDSWMNRKVSKRTCMTVPYGSLTQFACLHP